MTCNTVDNGIGNKHMYSADNYDGEKLIQRNEFKQLINSISSHVILLDRPPITS